LGERAGSPDGCAATIAGSVASVGIPDNKLAEIITKVNKKYFGFMVGRSSILSGDFQKGCSLT
jgi:hypothetical protein